MSQGQQGSFWGASWDRVADRAPEPVRLLHEIGVLVQLRRVGHMPLRGTLYRGRCPLDGQDAFVLCEGADSFWRCQTCGVSGRTVRTFLRWVGTSEEQHA